MTDIPVFLYAAFDARVNGVVLAREHLEMYLANLTAAADTLRAIFASHKGED